MNVRISKEIQAGNHILFKVDREVPLKVIKRKGRWLKIEHEDGDQGWIHASLVW